MRLNNKSMDGSKLLPGLVLGRVLGRGASSTVYEGVQDGRRVAVKLMAPPVGVDAEAVLSNLRYEFWVLKDLHHPNIVRVEDFGALADGRIFLIEELLEGVALDVFCRERAFGACELVFVDVLQGLAELARWHIVHGDLKPENILVTSLDDKPRAKILDFGLARAGGVGPDGSGAGTGGGTLTTMAPEVMLGRRGDTRADLYSLGVVLYTCLAGANPFLAKTSDETIAAHLHASPTLIGLVRDDVPPAWADLIHQLMAKNPFDRPATAAKGLSLVRRDAFTLTPTAYVGRRSELERALQIEKALMAGRKTALCVYGPPGAGVRRFLREVFYRLIVRRPEARGRIGLWDDPVVIWQDGTADGAGGNDAQTRISGSEGGTQILLLDRAVAPAGYDRIEIKLGPLTREETATWLGLVLGVLPVPGTFIEKVIALTLGYPAAVWEMLLRLNEKKQLTDVAGQVTAAKLALVDWETLTPGEQVSGAATNFDRLAADIKRRVRQRKIIESDPAWAEIERLAETGESAHRLRRRGDVLALKGEALIDEGKFDRARESLTAALEICKSDVERRVAEISLRNFLAYIMLRQGRAREAITAFEECLRRLQTELTPQEAARVTNLDLGLAYLQAGEFAQAVRRLSQELETADGAKAMSLLYSLAQAYAGLADTDRAEEHYRRVLAAARGQVDPAFILRGLNGIGNLLRATERWQEARAAYGEALEVALAVGDFGAALAIRQNQGALSARHGLYDQAILELEESLHFAAKIALPYAHEKRLICRSLTELGEVRVTLGQIDPAFEAVGRAWHMAEDDEDLRDMRFWVLLARCKVRLKQEAPDEMAYKRDLTRLRFFADDEAKKQALVEFEAGVPQAWSAAMGTMVAGRGERDSGSATGEAVGVSAAAGVFTSPAGTVEGGRRTSRAVAEATRTAGSAGASGLAAAAEFEVLLRINRDLVGEMPLEELLRRILGHAIELSQAELGVILLKDGKGELSPTLSLNAELNDALSEISRSVARKVLESGAAVKTVDAGVDPQFNQSASVIALHLRSILGVPIVFRGATLGVLYLSHRLRIGAFDERVTYTVAAFADQAGLALTNHRLLEFHRAAQERLAVELEESRLDLKQARERMRSLPEKTRIQLADRPLITRSTTVVEILRSIDRLAESNVAVIINGETGTGKELLARYVHEGSPRKRGPFVAINCGALPANLIESELFGHVRGAFTGADRDKIGLIEAAASGTLFLDEIGDLPPDLQVKFLRVLQEREVTRLGDRRGKAVDVRVVAASHRDLRTAMADKKFREDLYYRLAGFEVTLPALRDRPEDIILLAEHFLSEYRRESKRDKPTRLGGPLLKMMEEYAWPGNIRELANFVTTAAALCEKAVLGVEALPHYLSERLTGRGLEPPLAVVDGMPAGSVVTAGQVFDVARSSHLPKQATTRHPAMSKALPVGWYHPGMSWQDHEHLVFASALIALDSDVPRVATSLGVGVATVYKWMRAQRFRESFVEWQKRILPYREGEALKQIQKNVFAQVAGRYPGQPYKAARELAVAPTTFYKWVQSDL